MTSATLRTHAQRIWGWLQTIVVAIALVSLLANILGFRLDSATVGYRFRELEKVDSSLKATDDTLRTQDRVLAAELQGLRIEFKTFSRLQCLATTRRDADYAGACQGLPTKDERRP